MTAQGRSQTEAEYITLIQQSLSSTNRVGCTIIAVDFVHSFPLAYKVSGMLKMLSLFTFVMTTILTGAYNLGVATASEQRGAWSHVYSADKNGKVTYGKITNLIDRIRSGSSVKIIVHVGNQYILSEYPNRIWIHKDRVFASTQQYHFNFNPKDTTWDETRTPMVAVFGTDGTEKVFGIKNPHRWAMDWFVD